jgi:2',3'-cyclic-nucleotide 2'-phosphodiesterase (5'-nucleotidase family)
VKRWRSLWSGILLFSLLVSACASQDPARREGNELHVKILAINDFHGDLSKDGLKDKGSAPVLAAYLQAAA